MGDLRTDEAADLGGPSFKGRSLLISEAVTLVDSDDPCARPAQMVQNRLRDLEPNAQPLQACGDRASNVMKPPFGY